jgi:hypothetical protein
MSTPLYQNTGDADIIVDAVVSLLQSDNSIGLRDVWTEDPIRVPRTPSAAVLAGTITTGGGSPTGTGMGLSYYTNNQITIYVMVFFARIVENSVLSQEANRYASRVRDVIHTNKTLDGLVYQGWVTQIEPGVARRAGAKFRANRLTIVYSSKTFI